MESRYPILEFTFATPPSTSMLAVNAVGRSVFAFEGAGLGSPEISAANTPCRLVGEGISICTRISDADSTKNKSAFSYAVPATVVCTTTVVVVDGAVVSGEFNPNGMSCGSTSLTEPDFGTAHDASNTQSAPICNGRRL